MSAKCGGVGRGSSTASGDDRCPGSFRSGPRERGRGPASAAVLAFLCLLAAPAPTSQAQPQSGEVRITVHTLQAANGDPLGGVDVKVVNLTTRVAETRVSNVQGLCEVVRARAGDQLRLTPGGPGWTFDEHDRGCS